MLWRTSSVCLFVLLVVLTFLAPVYWMSLVWLITAIGVAHGSYELAQNKPKDFTGETDARLALLLMKVLAVSCLVGLVWGLAGGIRWWSLGTAACGLVWPILSGSLVQNLVGEIKAAQLAFRLRILNPPK